MLCDAPLTNQTVTSRRIYIVKIYSNKITLQIMCKPWTWCIYPKRSDGKSSVNFINTLCAAPLTNQTLTTSWRIHIFKMHSNETTLQTMWKPWACGSHEHWAIYIYIYDIYIYILPVWKIWFCYQFNTSYGAIHTYMRAGKYSTMLL